MFSIRFGPKLIEVKTLISNSFAVLKYHAGKRHRVIWEELSVNEGFRENEKKGGFGFFRVEKGSSFLLPPVLLHRHQSLDHCPLGFLTQGRSMSTALLLNIFWVQLVKEPGLENESNKVGLSSTVGC